MAIRVSGHPDASQNGTFYLHADHLGSHTVQTNRATGQKVAASEARFYPFGGYRTAPTEPLTGRGYTGHRHNDDLGLIYMNARYYVPGIGRFASADTIVPDPANPQAFNRYSYVLNNPLQLVDPSGHRSCSATEASNDFETCDENIDDTSILNLSLTTREIVRNLLRTLGKEKIYASHLVESYLNDTLKSHEALEDAANLYELTEDLGRTASDIYVEATNWQNQNLTGQMTQRAVKGSRVLLDVVGVEDQDVRAGSETFTYVLGSAVESPLFLTSAILLSVGRVKDEAFILALQTYAVHYQYPVNQGMADSMLAFSSANLTRVATKYGSRRKFNAE